MEDSQTLENNEEGRVGGPKIRGKSKTRELRLSAPLTDFTFVPLLGDGSQNLLPTHEQALWEPATPPADRHPSPDRFGWWVRCLGLADS